MAAATANANASSAEKTRPVYLPDDPFEKKEPMAYAFFKESPVAVYRVLDPQELLTWRDVKDYTETSDCIRVLSENERANFQFYMNNVFGPYDDRQVIYLGTGIIALVEISSKSIHFMDYDCSKNYATKSYIKVATEIFKDHIKSIQNLLFRQMTYKGTQMENAAFKISVLWKPYATLFELSKQSRTWKRTLRYLTNRILKIQLHNEEDPFQPEFEKVEIIPNMRFYTFSNERFYLSKYDAIKNALKQGIDASTIQCFVMTQAYKQQIFAYTTTTTQLKMAVDMAGFHREKDPELLCCMMSDISLLWIKDVAETHIIGPLNTSIGIEKTDEKSQKVYATSAVDYHYVRKEGLEAGYTHREMWESKKFTLPRGQLLNAAILLGPNHGVENRVFFDKPQRLIQKENHESLLPALYFLGSAALRGDSMFKPSILKLCKPIEVHLPDYTHPEMFSERLAFEPLVKSAEIESSTQTGLLKVKDGLTIIQIEGTAEYVFTEEDEVLDELPEINEATLPVGENVSPCLNFV